MFKKLVCILISISMVLCVCFFGDINAQNTQTEFERFFNKYSDVAAYSIANYTGDYDATTFGDTYSDLYTLSYQYTTIENPSHHDFHGYIYTIDEAKKVFGETDEGVIGAINAGETLFAPHYDNSIRHVDDVEDSNGIKKDAWFSSVYYRKDKQAPVSKGGISFGIKDGSKITENDRELTFIFEYLDNTEEDITLQYVNNNWTGEKFIGGSLNISRTGTNTWKTGCITVSDAMFAPESDNRNTGLCTRKEDFLLKGNDMYISSMMVIKSDEITEYARATAKYTGGYDATEFKEEISDLYAYGYLYTKLSNKRANFNGYIYTIDEAKKVYGENDESVRAAQRNGCKYYAPRSDNSFRYEENVEDILGIKKDAWHSDKYWRADEMEERNGGISFGIKDGSRIKETDRELTFRIEYLDKDTTPFELQYISSGWTGDRYVGNTVKYPRTGSNEWKTAYISVNDAFFAPESDSRTTAICSGKEDFIIKGNNLYIHSVTVVPTSLASIVAHQTDNLPATVYTNKDAVTGRTWYAMQIPGKRTFRSYVTVQSWNKSGTKFLVSANSKLYEFDTLNHTYKFLDAGDTGSCYVSPENDIYYIWSGYAYKIDWDTYEKTTLCKFSDEISGFGSLCVTTDGRYFSGYPYLNGEHFAALVILDTKTGTICYEGEKDFSYNKDTLGIGHPILNPKYKNLLFFCHEGTTEKIPDRLWMVDTDTGIMQNIFKQSYNENGTTAECSGHEVWNKDGEYLYFVKYGKKQNKGQNGIVRIPFKDGKFTGEREYINGDAKYWHCYPSGDNNWVVADVNTGEVWIMSTNTHKSYQIADFELVSGERTDPHPHFSYASNSINWDIDFGGDTSKRGVAWADVSDITLSKEYNETRIPVGDNTEAVSVTNTKSEVKTEVISGKTFVKATSGNNVYINIKDDFAKSVNQNITVSFSTYSTADATMNIGYTSPVESDQNWHEYEDRSATVAIKKGTNSYSVNFGNININNINKYRSDLVFTSSLGDTYIADVKIDTYSDGYKNAPSKACAITATPMNHAGLCVVEGLYNMAHVDDTIECTNLGISSTQIQEAKNKGYSYLSTGLDGAFTCKNVTDTDGVTKNAWFITKSYRVNTDKNSNVSGFLYFNVDTDTITANDNKLYLTIEYLDNRRERFDIQYINSTGTQYTELNVRPTNTGKWKRDTFIIEDAGIALSASDNVLLNGRADVRIVSREKDLYVSKIAFEKPGSKYITNIKSGISNGNVTFEVDAVNNTSDSSKIKVYTGVYDTDGKLKRASVSSEVTLGAQKVLSVLSDPVAINKDETAKVFVLGGNIMPYIPSENTLDINVVVSDTNTKLTWTKYPYGYEVHYKIFCDGVQVGATYDTEFTYNKSLSGTHNWHIEICDVYGRNLWFGIASKVTKK